VSGAARGVKLTAMLGPIVVLWLGQGAERTAHDAEIQRWAAAHELRAMPPHPARGPAYDPRAIESIEGWLDEARTTTGGSGASEALERARALLAAHPELPQAAWLLAESYAMEAHARAARGEANARGEALVELARSLEGPRAAPAAGAPAPPSVATPEVARPPNAAVRLRLSGARPNDRVLLDGAELGAAEARMITPGRHQVQLARARRSVWATWADVDATGALALSDPTLPCSEIDLADVTPAADGPRPAPGVACEHWAAARPGTFGGVEVSLCEASRCARWEASPAWRGPSTAFAAAAPGVSDEARRWPGWLTWGLVGIGAGAITGVILWQAGAFDRSAQATEYVFTGPTAAAYRF
jgi:hypothetical protein